MPKMVYFIKNGKFKVVKEVRMAKHTERPSMRKSSIGMKYNTDMFEDDKNEIKFLELDELESGDVFCHCNVIDKKPMDHSIVSVLPS
jgi:hypothetical protein